MVGLGGEDALELLQLVSDVGQHSEAQHLHVLIVALGEVEKVVDDHDDVFVLEEDAREGL